MVEVQDSVSYKRRRSVQETYSTQALQSSRKRQKVDDTNCDAPNKARTHFWDSLSKIWLTKRALKELDRRNFQSAHDLPSRPEERRIRFTRNSYVEWKRKERVVPLSGPKCYNRSAWNDVRRFARHGGPDLIDLRQYSEPVDPLSSTMRFSQSNSRTRKRYTKSSSKTISSEKSSAYDRNFEQNLIDHGVFPEEYEYPDGRDAPIPNNLEEIEQRLSQPRPSLSPSIFSDGQFKDFKRINAHAFKEEDVMASVVPIISGKIKSDKTVARDIIFGNLNPLTDGKLVLGKPDIFHGARPEQLARQIRKDLAGHIIPSTLGDVPILPNFFLEAKGPDGSLAVAGRQACYTGALGARAVHSLQFWGAEPIFDGNSYTITSIYHGGTLKMYTTHPSKSQSPDRPLDYHTTQLNSYAISGNQESFRQGATAYRNARDWAKEQRDSIIEKANSKVADVSITNSSETRSSIQVRLSAVAADSPESDTSADELALDDDVGRSSSRKRIRRGLPRSSSEHHQRYQTAKAHTRD